MGSGLSMPREPRMPLSTSRNRRRADAADRTGQVRVAASRFGRALGRALLVLAIAVAVVAGGALAVEHLRTSARFAIQRVSFVGLDQVTEAELLRLAALGSGQNLFTLDVGQAERAMASHPWIRRLSISRRLPDGLVVEVTEHVGAALLALGELYVVDEQGRSFRRVQPGDPLDLLLITGLERDAYVEDTEKAARRVAEAIRVARAYAASPAGSQVALSEARLEGEAVVLLTERHEVLRLGDGDLAKKLERLAKVRTALGARALQARIIHLDNRVRPDWVAVQLRDWDGGSERTAVP